MAHKRDEMKRKLSVRRMKSQQVRMRKAQERKGVKLREVEANSTEALAAKLADIQETCVPCRVLAPSCLPHSARFLHCPPHPSVCLCRAALCACLRLHLRLRAREECWVAGRLGAAADWTTWVIITRASFICCCCRWLFRKA